jgi:menaquinone-dependent protoporphyrinogen oxidase
MKKILVAYASNAGSTAEIAQVIAKKLKTDTTHVDVRMFHEAGGPHAYDAVVLGAPMMMGWHPGMLNYITMHKDILASKPVAYFITALNLTDTGETHMKDTPIYKDENLARPPHKPGKLNLKERRTSIAGYLNPILAAAPSVIPSSIAFFGGNLDFRKLKWKQILFVKLLVRAKPGDHRNWDAIHTWTDSLQTIL